MSSEFDEAWGAHQGGPQPAPLVTQGPGKPTSQGTTSVAAKAGRQAKKTRAAEPSRPDRGRQPGPGSPKARSPRSGIVVFVVGILALAGGATVAVLGTRARVTVPSRAEARESVAKARRQLAVDDRTYSLGTAAAKDYESALASLMVELQTLVASTESELEANRGLVAAFLAGDVPTYNRLNDERNATLGQVNAQALLVAEAEAEVEKAYGKLARLGDLAERRTPH